jgi:hypothetical protein
MRCPSGVTRRGDEWRRIEGASGVNGVDWKSGRIISNFVQLSRLTLIASLILLTL